MSEQLLQLFVFVSLLASSFGESQNFTYTCVDDGINHRKIEISGFKKDEPIRIAFGKDPSTCSATGTGSDDDPFRLSISLNTPAEISDCGVVSDTDNVDRYTVDVFTQSLNGAYRSNDRMYRIECDFSAFGTVNTQVTATPDMARNLAIDMTEAAENCNLMLRSGDGNSNLLTTVMFRDSVLLQAACSLTAPDATGFRVTTCTAVGGTESSSPSVPLIASNGCGDSQSDIIPQSDGFAVRGENPGILETPVFEMFAFRVTTSVLFTCRVYICYGDSVDCSQSCSTLRERRDVGGVETREVLATVTIVPEASALINPGGGVTTDSCQDRTYQILIISLALLLLFTLLLAILFFAKLNKKRRREEDNPDGQKKF